MALYVIFNRMFIQKKKTKKDITSRITPSVILLIISHLLRNLINVIDSIKFVNN